MEKKNSRQRHTIRLTIVPLIAYPQGKKFYALKSKNDPKNKNRKNIWSKKIRKNEHIEKKELAAPPYHRINSIISWGIDYTKSLRIFDLDSMFSLSKEPTSFPK